MVAEFKAPEFAPNLGRDAYSAMPFADYAESISARKGSQEKSLTLLLSNSGQKISIRFLRALTALPVQCDRICCCPFAQLTLRSTQEKTLTGSYRSSRALAMEDIRIRSSLAA